MISVLELETMSKMEIEKIDRNNLVGINNVRVDPSLPDKQRMEHYLGQVINPYCFMSGDTLVRIRFVNKGKSLSQSLINFYSNLKIE